ncbi:MAG: radical SAM protein [Deltaproteobacteria bacterium]|nr:radical SAM protein [Deltaproteobacteria bacterium]
MKVHPEDWRRRARALLVDHPRGHLRVGDLIDHAELPRRDCVLPWTRLELSTRRFLGPCCADFQREPVRVGGSFADAWNGSVQRSFRRALSRAGHPETCRESCPTLRSGRERLAEMQLRGGSAPFVENQLMVLEDLLEGREQVRGQPLELMVPPTTFCNYDCLMCEWGEVGTLEDELSAEFYDALAPLLPSVRALEVAGGEPLASPIFRDFLLRLDRDIYPDLRISLVTNGSYLSPGHPILERVPFSTIIISLNAASPETYAAVNRGLAFERVRGNLDALLEARRRGSLRGDIIYSMVLLKQNRHEIAAFVELAERDDVRVRFMLPMFDRNRQSVMTDEQTMREVLHELDRAAERLNERGETRQAQGVLGEADVLRERLAQRLFEPLPDGRADPQDEVEP